MSDFWQIFRFVIAALLTLAGVFCMISAAGFSVATAKMVVVILFLWITSPVASHLIGRLEVTINDELEKDMAVMDETAVQHEKEGD